MKKNILKDSNALLGFMISVKDDSNNCKVDKIFDVVGYNKTLEIQNLINELSDKNLVKQTNTQNIYIFEQGISAYVSPAKQLWRNVKAPISYIFTYIMGILSSVAVQLIIDAITSNTTP